MQILLYFLLALVLHFSGYYLLLSFARKSIKSIRSEFGLFRLLFEMSGIMFNLVLAFVLMLLVSLSTKDQYLPIESLQYGLKFSETAKKLGFEDGDNIITIGGKRIKRFSEIMPELLLTPDLAEVEVRRQNRVVRLKLSNESISEIINDTSEYLVRPIAFPPLGEPGDTIRIHHERLGFSDAWKKYRFSINRMFSTIRMIMIPDSMPYEASFYVARPNKEFKDNVSHIAIWCLWISFFNLIPLPGMNLGNGIIAVIERVSGKMLEGLGLKILRVCFSVIIFAIATLLFV